MYRQCGAAWAPAKTMWLTSESKSCVKPESRLGFEATVKRKASSSGFELRRKSHHGFASEERRSYFAGVEDNSKRRRDILFADEAMRCGSYPALP